MSYGDLPLAARSHRKTQGLSRQSHRQLSRPPRHPNSRAFHVKPATSPPNAAHWRMGPLHSRSVNCRLVASDSLHRSMPYQPAMPNPFAPITESRSQSPQPRVTSPGLMVGPHREQREARHWHIREPHASQLVLAELGGIRPDQSGFIILCLYRSYVRRQGCGDVPRETADHETRHDCCPLPWPTPQMTANGNPSRRGQSGAADQSPTYRWSSRYMPTRLHTGTATTATSAHVSIHSSQAHIPDLRHERLPKTRLSRAPPSAGSALSGKRAHRPETGSLTAEHHSGSWIPSA